MHPQWSKLAQARKPEANVSKPGLVKKSWFCYMFIYSGLLISILLLYEHIVIGLVHENLNFVECVHILAKGMQRVT